MAKLRKNWSEVTINGVAFSKRPTRIGKGETGVLVGYAQVPIIPDPLSEADAKHLLLEWLESGVLGYRQTLTATINALAVQTQAEVRRKYTSVKNGKHSDAAIYNIGFNHIWSTDQKRAIDLMGLSETQRTPVFMAAGREKLALGTAFDVETNVVTSDNTMSVEVDEQ